MITPSMTRDEIIREFEKDKKQIVKLSRKIRNEMIKNKKSFVFKVFESKNHNTYTLYCSIRNKLGGGESYNMMYVAHCESFFGTKDYVMYRNVCGKPFIIRFSSHAAKRIKERGYEFLPEKVEMTSDMAVVSLFATGEFCVAVKANGPFRKKIDKYLDSWEMFKGGDLEDSDTYVCMIAAGFLVLKIKEGEVIVKTYLGDTFRHDCINNIELKSCILIFEYIYASVIGEDPSEVVVNMPAEVLNEMQLLPLAPYSVALRLAIDNEYGEEAVIGCDALFKGLKSTVYRRKEWNKKQYHD